MVRQQLVDAPWLTHQLDSLEVSMKVPFIVSDFNGDL